MRIINMNRYNIQLKILAVFLLGFPFCFIISTHASGLYNDMQMQSLAKAFNLPVNKVGIVLEQQSNLLSINQQILSLLNEDNFAGSYIDPVSNRIYINTLSGEILPDMLTHISSDNHNLIQAVKVNYSLTTLNKVKNELAEVIKQHDISFYAFGVDIKHNNLIATIAQNMSNNPFLKPFINKYPELLNVSYVNLNYTKNYTKKSKEINDKVFNNTITKNTHLHSRDQVLLSGGDGIRNLDSYVLCSLGFWCKTSSGDNVLTTAGHCLVNSEGPWYHKPWNLKGTPNYGNLIGYKISAVNQPTDFGYISIAGLNVLPSFYIQNSDDPVYPLLKIKGRVDAGVGAFICRSGFNTHFGCGSVVLTGQTLKEEQTGEILSNLDAVVFLNPPQEGDSGGPYFAFESDSSVNVKAVGTHVGRSCIQYSGSPICTPTNVAVMHPLSYTLPLYDLRLVVPFN
ncbi:hypothetical protein Glove_212g200 [Diversispora epigaea]|uniref:Peptidase S1 domain-containing protein n=1 Tax=Diversispora epigaea TaxID=1348612 RepID=A0A397IKV1_9GLOM|nr:hypothetical protein Glove_212g200 [Diversispora epigaea]